VGSLVEAGNRTDPVVVNVILDGFTAPISAGNFADLALRGFYNGLPLYDGLGLQANKSAVGKNALGCGTVSANVTGFVNPYTGDYRTVPLEYKGAKASEPVYVEEDEAEQQEEEGGADKGSPGWGAQRAQDQKQPPSSEPPPQLLPPLRMASGPPSLPFEADGVLGLFHPPGDPDGASSQFFWLANPERDGRRLNGRYAPFAVVVGGYSELLSLRAGDVLENVQLDPRAVKALKRPGPNPQYSRRESTKSIRDYNMLSGDYLERENVISSEVPLEGGR
jgi:peptidylprolyl isomerase